MSVTTYGSTHRLSRSSVSSSTGPTDVIETAEGVDDIPYPTPDYDRDMEEQYSSKKSMSHSDLTSIPKSRTPSRRTRVLQFLRNNVLLFLLVLSMIIGIGMGVGIRNTETPFTKREIIYLRFPGDLLMNMLKLLILPLVVSSLISGLASLDTRASGKMGLRAVVYYLTTTLIAVVLGIVLTVLIRPGERGGDIDRSGEMRVVNPADTFLDLLRQAFPDNLIEACFSKPVTDQVAIHGVVEDKNQSLTQNGTRKNETRAAVTYEPVLTKVPGMNVLGLVVFSIFFGVVIGNMGPKGKPLVDFFNSLSEAIMKLVHLVIWYSPIGVCFLLSAKVVEMDDPEKTFHQLLFFCVTVLSGLFIHGFIALPLIYFVAVRKNPFKFIYGVIQAVVTALGTSSSSATLPVTMKCLEENNGIDKRVTKFVIPVGATINMDGTALYEAVAVLFIGQVQGFDMDIGQIITISVTATAAAIGAAGVPQAGLVTMVIVLTAVGFPTDDVTIVLAIDWFVDRFRTAVNVLGDAIGAGIVAHLSRKELEAIDEIDDTEKLHYVPDGISNVTFAEERF